MKALELGACRSQQVLGVQASSLGGGEGKGWHGAAHGAGTLHGPHGPVLVPTPVTYFRAI